MASFRRRRGEYWQTPPEDRPLALTGFARRYTEVWGDRLRVNFGPEMGPGEWLTLPVLSLVRAALVLMRDKLKDPASEVSWSEPALLLRWTAGPGWARELILEEKLDRERVNRAVNQEQLSFVLLTLTRRVGSRETGRKVVPPGGTEPEDELEVFFAPSMKRDLEELPPEARDARTAELLAPLLIGGIQARFDHTIPPNVKLSPEVARSLVVPAEPGLAFEGEAAGRFVSGSLAVSFHPLEVGEEGDRYPVAVALMMDPESAYLEGEADEAGLSEVRGVTLDPPDLSTWSEAEREALFEGLLAWLDEMLSAYPGRKVLGHFRADGAAQEGAQEASAESATETEREPETTAGETEPALAALRATAEPVREVTLHEGATRIDKAALARLNALSGLTLPQSLAKVPRWEDLCREEAERIYSEQGDAALRPVKDIRGPLLEKKTDRKTGATVFALTKEAEEGLVRSKGSRGFRRTLEERDGRRREYFMKQFRSSGGFAALGLSWYGEAAPFAADETRRALERQQDTGGELFEEDRDEAERKLRRLGSIRDAHELAVLLLHRFGEKGENPLRLTAAELRVGLACEKDPNGLDRVRGALAALQELRFVFSASAVGGGLEASGPFLSELVYFRKGAGGHGEGYFFVTISEGFVGVLRVFNTAEYRIRDARTVLRYDWGKKLEDKDREELSSGFLRGFSSLAPYYDKAAGLTDAQKRLRLWIEHNLTLKKDQAARGREAVRAKRGAPDGDEPRVYEADFCPLLPQGQRFHGALGHFQRTRHGEPEKGRTLGGRRTRPSRDGKSGGKREGLLDVMGYSPPSGAARARRLEVYRNALQDIRRVVVEELEGVAAGRTPDGRWFTLEAAGDNLSESELREGVSWCLFLPEGWRHQRRETFQRRQAERFERGETPYRVTVSTGPTVEADASAAWKRLPQARKDRKLSQAEVGRLFGVSQQVVAYWEAGPEPDEGGRVRGKAVPAYLEPLLRRWIETGEAPTADELVAARG